MMSLCLQMWYYYPYSISLLKQACFEDSDYMEYIKKLRSDGRSRFNFWNLGNTTDKRYYAKIRANVRRFFIDQSYRLSVCTKENEDRAVGYIVYTHELGGESSEDLLLAYGIDVRKSSTTITNDKGEEVLSSLYPRHARIAASQTSQLQNSASTVRWYWHLMLSMKP